MQAHPLPEGRGQGPTHTRQANKSTHHRRHHQHHRRKCAPEQKHDAAQQSSQEPKVDFHSPHLHRGHAHRNGLSTRSNSVVLTQNSFLVNAHPEAAQLFSQGYSALKATQLKPVNCANPVDHAGNRSPNGIRKNNVPFAKVEHPSLPPPKLQFDRRFTSQVVTGQPVVLQQASFTRQQTPNTRLPRLWATLENKKCDVKTVPEDSTGSLDLQSQSRKPYRCVSFSHSSATAMPNSNTVGNHPTPVKNASKVDRQRHKKLHDKGKTNAAEKPRMSLSDPMPRTLDASPLQAYFFGDFIRPGTMKKTLTSASPGSKENGRPVRHRERKESRSPERRRYGSSSPPRNSKAAAADGSESTTFAPPLAAAPTWYSKSSSLTDAPQIASCSKALRPRVGPSRRKTQATLLPDEDTFSGVFDSTNGDLLRPAAPMSGRAPRRGTIQDTPVIEPSSLLTTYPPDRKRRSGSPSYCGKTPRQARQPRSLKGPEEAVEELQRIVRRAAQKERRSLSPSRRKTESLAGCAQRFSKIPGVLKEQKRNNGAFPVTLRIYDITMGRAARWSKLVLGKTVEGVWHTGLLVYGFEYFYGDGILKMRPTAVEQVMPITLKYELYMGETTVLKRDFEEFLVSVAHVFTPSTYDIFAWNCNHFSECCTQKLVSRSIPKFILAQDQLIARCPNGNFILALTKLFSGGSSSSGSGSVSASAGLARTPD